MIKKFLLPFIVIAVLPCLQGIRAQSKDDSLAFISADWEWKTLERGAMYGTARIMMFGSTQNISIVKFPAKAFRTQLVHSPGADANTADTLAMKHGAKIAINGSFFNTKTLYPHTFFTIGHKILGESSSREHLRSNGILAFKDRKGRKMEIFPYDTTAFDSYRKHYQAAIAAGPLLRQDGKDYPSDTALAFNSTRHPRSIIGHDDNGYYYFIVIDGRFPGQGEGTTIPETTAIARYAGLTDAINMDGGGSSTLWTETTGVINHPTDNGKFDHEGCRTVPNIIIAR